VAVRGSHARVAALELQWYMRNQLLRDADWAGMAHSLEIRVPLIDHVLFRALAPLLVSPLPPDKALFASTPQNPPPLAVLERAKTGFVIPVREWIAARSGRGATQRGLRGWARTVLPVRRGKRVLALVTDAFGGHGGIAQFNRDLLTVLCQMPEVAAVTAVPRLMPADPGRLPAKLAFLLDGLGGKWRYVMAIAREIAAPGPVDLIVCGHINLLPLAFVCRLFKRAPLLLCIHGIDAWTPPKSFLSRVLVKSAQRVISVSQITASRFAAWSGVGRDRIVVVPNAVHLDWYGSAPKSAALLRRYGLEGKVVIATLGRLVSEERYKGFDQVLDVLPALIERVPNLVYLIMGDGTDRARIERRVAESGLAAHVAFTGFVPESEKADYFRLADAYVMPSRGEGFGIVILEALACGLRVVGSRLDGTSEALRDGMLGELVDPDSPAEIRDAVLRALATPGAGVPQGLAHFGFPEFDRRIAAVVSCLISREGASPLPLSVWSGVPGD
jgi:glycosyltransferase involved in cell wall biosynthesis